MKADILVDNEFITLRYIPDAKVIHHTIHKPISNPDLTKAMETGLKAMQQHGASKWLSDDRLNGPIDLTDMETPIAWGKRMVAAGWRFWANVVPEELVAASTLIPFMEQYHEIGLRMMVFTNVDDAFEWLKSI